jgi:hypothetical protein
VLIPTLAPLFLPSMSPLDIIFLLGVYYSSSSNFLWNYNTAIYSKLQKQVQAPYIWILKQQLFSSTDKVDAAESKHTHVRAHWDRDLPSALGSEPWSFSCRKPICENPIFFSSLLDFTHACWEINLRRLASWILVSIKMD